MEFSVPLKKSLLSCNDDTSDIDNIDNLRHIHEQMLNDGHNNNNKKEELLAILGGIDEILQFYTSQSNLKDEQINQITQIISNTKQQNNRSKCLTLYFATNNTFIHHMFGLDFGDKLMNIVYHKIMIALIGLILLLVTSTIFYLDKYGIVMAINWITIIGFIIYMIFVFLSVNIAAFKLITRSFEFWFKMYIVIKLCVCSITLMGIRAMVVLSLLNFAIVTMNFSLIDGLNTSLVFKMVIGVLISCVVSVQAFLFTFVSQTVNVTLDIGGYDIIIDLDSWIAGSLRVLSIFLWKQTILAIWKRGKTTNIKTSYTIRWIENNK